MLNVLLSLAAVLGILITSEKLAKNPRIKKEWTRKFVHVAVGTFVAFWPWIMSWQAIQLISVCFLVVVLLSRRFNLFSSIRSVKRMTYGDVFFAMAVGISATITTDELIFCIAILMMAIADGVAALIGNKYGGAWGYKVVKQHKTLIGSMAFWLLSLAILGIGLLFEYQTLGYREYIYTIVILPPILTLLENVMPLGSDNLAIPLVTIAFLSLI